MLFLQKNKITLLSSGLLLGFLLAALLPSSCYYDNEEELYGITNCDTSAVTFSAHIKPLIDNNCVSCHRAGGSQSDYLLETYAQIKTYVDNGLLVGRTNDAASPMPPSGLMPDCDRNTIKAWIARGAKND